MDKCSEFSINAPNSYSTNLYVLHAVLLAEDSNQAGQPSSKRGRPSLVYESRPVEKRPDHPHHILSHKLAQHVDGVDGVGEGQPYEFQGGAGESVFDGGRGSDGARGAHGVRHGRYPPDYRGVDYDQEESYGFEGNGRFGRYKDEYGVDGAGPERHLRPPVKLIPRYDIDIDASGLGEDSTTGVTHLEPTEFPQPWDRGFTPSQVDSDEERISYGKSPSHDGVGGGQTVNTKPR